MSDEQLDRLLDQIMLLEKSLADARHEFEAGDLDRADLDAIEERDQARLAAAREAVVERRRLLDAAVPPVPRDGDGDGDADADGDAEDDGGPSAAPAAESRRRPAMVVLSVLVAALLGVGLALIIHRGASSSSSQVRTYTPAEISRMEALLSQAASLVQAGKVTESLQIYSQVLAIDPAQPEALAQSGYLTFEAGISTRSNQLASKGAAEIRASVEANPNSFASRLYLGVVELVGRNDPAAAMVQFEEFLKLKPPAQWVAQAQPYLAKAAAELKVPVPTMQPG